MAKNFIDVSLYSKISLKKSAPIEAISPSNRKTSSQNWLLRANVYIRLNRNSNRT